MTANVMTGYREKAIAAGMNDQVPKPIDIAVLFELMTDVDEGMQEWRYRHVKMVERTIGHKPGTGGSEGAGYLRSTLFQPLFPDLWEIRTQL